MILMLLNCVPAQLLHLSAAAEHESEVHAERPDVGAGLAGHPEDAQVAVGHVLDQLGLVDGAHAQLALHRGYQRRPLEQRALQPLQLLKEEGSCRV